MPKVFTSKSQQIGEVGEHIATQYLINKGFKILERNYTKKCGELDIVAKKGSIVHFIEVKSQTIGEEAIRNIDRYKPEDNMHYWKIQRLRKTIQLYLSERRVHSEWQFDLITVYLNPISKQAKVGYMDNIIL